MSKYDDIIDHPHYQSSKRKHMSMIERSAQFAPFAALTGYGEMVDQTAEGVNSSIDSDLYQAEDYDNLLQ